LTVNAVTGCPNTETFSTEWTPRPETSARRTYWAT
jgi:hypothetical protein